MLAFLPRLLAALVAVGLVSLLGRIVSIAVARILVRSRIPHAHRGFFATAVRWAFVVIAIIVALNIVGLSGLATSLVASGGITAVVLGFAFRGIGENFLAGFFLVMGRTFKVGDVVRSGDFEGQVKGIELRHTHIRTSDGRDIFIPSIEIFSNPLVNYTKDGLRRLAFTIGVDYADDPARAQAVLLEATRSCAGVLAKPEPGTRITEFAENFVVLEVFFWLDTFAQPSGRGNVRTRVMEACRTAILDAGFTMSSEVTTNLVMNEHAGVDVRVSDARSGDGL